VKVARAKSAPRWAIGAAALAAFAATPAFLGVGAAATADLDAQIQAASNSCKGTAPAVASKVKSPQIRDWLRGRSPVPIIASPWGSPTSPLAKGKKGPWKVAFTNSFAGNAARQEVLKAWKAQVAHYKKTGLVSSSVEFLSNLNIPTHISQIRQAVREGADIIMDIGPSATATRAAIDDAGRAGVPVVTMDAPVTSRYAVNVTTNNWLQAVDWTSWMVKQLGGKGNVVMVEGIPGEPGSEIWEAAGKCVFSKFPDIKVVADVAGFWTESKAKTAMQKVLATNPGDIDAVWIQGPGSVGVIQAFEQSGRTLPKFMTSFGDQATLAYWHDHPELQMYVAPQPPQTSTIEAFRVMLRLLKGQRPITNAIYNVGPPITNANLKTVWKPSFQFPSSLAFGEIPQSSWMPDATLNKYFVNGKAEPK
jgi:ribose transport system substrate-binding protein